MTKEERDGPAILDKRGARPAVVYGSAIHLAVQEMFKARQSDVAFGVDDLLSAFRRAWVSEGFLSREHEEVLSIGERFADQPQ